MADEEVKNMLVKLDDKIDGLQTMVFNLDKTVSVELGVMQAEMSAIKEQDDRQNALLDSHHRRSDEIHRDNKLREQQLRLDIEAHKAAQDERLKAIEIPINFVRLSIKVLLALGAMAGAIYSILSLFGKS